jgi:DNA-binding MarR family transcriptional regulator/N-acetylglutamate synthase-like GNAT family acetyltransferase
MDFIEELGTLAIGSRLKNLSELLMKDMARIYKEQNVDFEPRWFTFFQLILNQKEISVTEIAKELKQTHPAAVQLVNVLEKKKLVKTKKDSSDGRKRLVSLSKKGKKLAKELRPLWEVVQKVTDEILNESDPELLERIAKVEQAINDKSTYERINRRLVERNIQGIEFILFEKKHQKIFSQLNKEWLESYLEISNHDKHILADPITEIVNKQGRIHLMVSGSTVIGTYVLQNLNGNNCELSKFTIDKNYRGRKLGERMLKHAIAEAKGMGSKSLLLFTHQKLVEATQLYYKMGFEEIKEHGDLNDKSGRCSMMLQLEFNQ